MVTLGDPPRCESPKPSTRCDTKHAHDWWRAAWQHKIDFQSIAISDSSGEAPFIVNIPVRSLPHARARALRGGG